MSALLLCSVSIAAQDSIPPTPEQKAINDAVKNTHVIRIGDCEPNVQRDSIESLIAEFYVDQYRHFQDPKAPYFMFMSKDANMALGVGGVVRMRGWYDWGGSIPTNGFVPYFINIPKDPTSRRKLAATPAGTAIFMTIIGRNTRFGNVLGYIEGGFNGWNNIGFKLKKAYVNINDWTIGYATSTFVDPATQPPTIDGAGPNGFANRTNVLVRYFHTFKNKWSVGAGVEIPHSYPNVSDTLTKACTDYVPDIVALGQYQWNGGMSHVRLAGLLRLMQYRDVLQGRNHNIIGWGAQLSTVIKVIPQLNLYGQISVGQGHGSYLAELSCDNFDLVPDANNPSKLYAPTSMGATLGLRYFFRSNIYSCLALGQMRYYPRNRIDDTQYKYGQYGAINVYWDITPRIQVGAEYLMGKRMNFNGQHASAKRIDALFMLSF